MRVCIDTNVWLSSLMGKDLSELPDYLQNNKIQILTSLIQIDELTDVLNRPKLLRYFSREEAKTLLEYLYQNSCIIEIRKEVVHIVKEKQIPTLLMQVYLDSLLIKYC